MTAETQPESAATRRGMLASIYRSAAPDCSLNGISSRAEKVTIVGEIDADNIGRPLDAHSRVFNETEDAPGVYIVHRTVMSKRVTYMVPADGRAPSGFMFGGTYVEPGDSRVSRLIGFYGAVALHDRWEP